MEQAREAYLQTVRNLEKEITKLQARCKHEKTTYHSDPSGGSDSYHECDDCEKQF